MVGITRNVWDGNDYVPFVWDRWLGEEKGVAMVAELDGQVVGLQHAELHADGSAWLEAIRVAESLQGRGIGQALMKAGLDWARFEGANAVRLTTASHNPSSNRLAEKAGFRVIQRFAPMRPKESSDYDRVEGARVAFPSDEGAIWRLLTDSLPVSLLHFYTEGWTAYRFSRGAFSRLLGTQQISVLGVGGELEAAALTPTPVGRPSLKIGMIAGSQYGMTGLASWLRSKAAEQDVEPIRATLPIEHRDGIAALEAAGFERWSEWHMVLHELELVDSL